MIMYCEPVFDSWLIPCGIVPLCGPGRAALRAESNMRRSRDHAKNIRLL